MLNNLKGNIMKSHHAFSICFVIFLVLFFKNNLSAQTDTIWFDTEKFETGARNTFNSNWHPNIWIVPNITVETPPYWAVSNPMVGDSCVKFNFPVGAVAPYGCQHFGDAPDSRTPCWPGYEDSVITEVYFQYTLGYSEGYSWEFGNNKQFIIGCEDGQSHSYVCCNPSTAYYLTIKTYSVNDDSAYLESEINNKQASSGHWIAMVPNYNGYSPSNQVIIHDATVYTIEHHIVLNDSGLANGVLETWVNGVKSFDYNNLYYRHFNNGGIYGVNGSWGLNQLFASWYINNPVTQEQAVYLFDVKMSTGYIGLIQTTNFEKQESKKLPKKSSLYQNYPNPFNPSTKIKFNLSTADHVKLELYDLNGKKIKTLFNNLVNAGLHEIDFIANDLSSGVYFYNFVTKDYQHYRKMIYIK